ncbi:reverse transcriptase domain-containing protein [Tanacetum coccineum]
MSSPNHLTSGIEDAFSSNFPDFIPASPEALSWWNSFAQPIRIEEAYKITWVEFKKLLIKKYCPRTEVQKMKDEFYHITVKGNDLKTYVRRFQELATLCPTMVLDYEKMMEVFIGGLPRSIERNVTASKPQTLEEAINIAQRLMDQEPEQNPETSTEKVQNPNLENTAHVPPPEEEDSICIEIPKPKAKKTVNVETQDLNSPRPNSYQSKLPYPERMKVRENDKPSAQHSRYLKMFKQLHLEIGLKDALVEMPKFNKWLSSLLKNKEKLEEIAITTVNVECFAIIMNKVPEKLEDPGKFLIPCALQELDRTNALADSRASINLLPHSIYKKLGLEALTPTRMTLELANRSITHPMGIAEDVVVRVDGFTFLADFVVVNFEPDPRVPIILGRPFLRTAKALIDLYEELTLRVGKEELVYYADKSEKNKDKNFVHAISVIDFSKADPFSGSTTTHSNDSSPSSSPSQENVHANQSSVIESLPVSPIPVEDSEPAQEEIDIFLVPNDLIPPGVEM